MDLQNKRIPDQEFYKIREEVLQQWPTGKAVNLDEAIAYHKSLPDKKVFSKKLIDRRSAHQGSNRASDLFAEQGRGGSSAHHD